MAALFGRDVLSSTLRMKVNSCNIESLAFWHGTKSQIQLVLDSFEFFAFLLQQATVMAKHTCDTYQKHAKVTNVFSFPVDVSVSGVESQAGVRKATTCPSHQRQKKLAKLVPAI